MDRQLTSHEAEGQTGQVVMAEGTAKGFGPESLRQEEAKPSPGTVRGHSALTDEGDPSKVLDEGPPRITEESSSYIPSQKEPPSARVGEGKSVQTEEKPSPSLPEQPSSTIADVSPPSTPEELKHLVGGGEEGRLPEVDEKGHPSVSDAEGKHPPVKDTGELPPVEKGPETVTKEEHLAPTEDLRKSVATTEQERPSTISEVKPSIEKPPQAIEAEKLSEKVPIAEAQQVAAEKEAPPAVVEKAQSTEGPAPVPTAEVKPQVSVEKEPLPPPVSKEPPPAITAKETAPAEAEYLAPTKDFKHIPVERSKEATPVVTEEGKHPVKEPPQVMEAEKPQEVPPVAEPAPVEPPAIAEKEVLPVIEEKDLPTTPQQQEPPTTAVSEERPLVVQEKEAPTATLDEAHATTITPKGPAPVEEVSVVPEGGGVQTLAPEEPPALTEPLAGVVEKLAEEVKEISPTWQIWHTDPAEHVLFAVAVILIAGKLGGETARLLNVPAVVGKIIIGMLLGNIYFLTGWGFFDFLRVMPFLKVLSDFGALTLLFTVGLHTDLRAVLRVGPSATLVALGSVVVPAGLGFLVGHFLLPDAPFNTKLLLVIILCATSMGIVLKTLEEAKALNTLEGGIIIGGVVLGDIVTMIAFGVACGILTSGGLPILGVMTTIGLIFLFISAIIVASLKYSRGLGGFITRSLPEGLQMAIVAVVCLLFAFLAESIGLHTVIGAFAAGLLLQNIRLRDPDNREYGIEWFIRPAYMLLVPIFFVRAGAQMRWESFLDINTIFLGLALTGASVFGKLFCGLCPIERGINRLAVGLAMVPKLEVTLVLASIGRSVEILDDAIFSSFMVLVVLTSTIAPPLLKLVLTREEMPIPEKGPIPYIEKEARKVKARLKRLGLR